MNIHAARLLRLQITCLNSLPALDADQSYEFGLQDRKQHLIAGMPQSQGAFRFWCDVTIKLQAQSDTPDFSGPCVHGTPGARFLYLSWRRCGAKDWLRRVKIPLTAITWEQIEAAQPGSMLAAHVAGDRSGTVSLLGDGWVVTKKLED